MAKKPASKDITLGEFMRNPALYANWTKTYREKHGKTVHIYEIVRVGWEGGSRTLYIRTTSNITISDLHPGDKMNVKQVTGDE